MEVWHVTGRREVELSPQTALQPMAGEAADPLKKNINGLGSLGRR